MGAPLQELRPLLNLTEGAAEAVAVAVEDFLALVAHFCTNQLHALRGKAALTRELVL